MSKNLTVLRALVTERLCAAAEEIVQLFASSVERHEGHEDPAGEEDNRTRAAGQTEEAAAERSRADVGVQTEFLFDGEIESSAQIFAKTDPNLCLKQEPEEAKELLPFCVKTVKSNHVEELLSVRHQRTKTQRNLKVEFGESSLSSDYKMDGQSNAFAVMDSNLTLDPLYPQELYFTDVANSAQTSDKILKTELDTNQHKCSQCGKVYLHRPSLCRHLLTHKEQKPFKCSVCQKGFSQKPHLTLHMRVHTGEKPFSCPFCDKTFSNSSNASQHLRVHTGHKFFTCSVCNAQFRGAKTLRDHMTLHARDGPFSCSGKDGVEEPCRCSVCGAEFGDDKTLGDHMTLHGKDGPFSCSEQDSVDLKTHSGQKPYRCSVCDRGFSQKQSLTKHLKLHSKKEVPEHLQHVLQS
ncbi:hypothetical protein WMY93_012912 [Mugilogobius chulae]|uniref:C2H2-type domain-containing protein n=1 Tax=Mugilogobius chulae TaxID=88201 RepID=A0AAW0P4Z3_9GOBI